MIQNAQQAQQEELYGQMVNLLFYFLRSALTFTWKKSGLSKMTYETISMNLQTRWIEALLTMFCLALRKFFSSMFFLKSHEYC